MINVGDLITGEQAEELPKGSGILAHWQTGPWAGEDGGSALVKVGDREWVSSSPGVAAPILHDESEILYEVLYIGHDRVADALAVLGPRNADLLRRLGQARRRSSSSEVLYIGAGRNS